MPEALRLGTAFHPCTPKRGYVFYLSVYTADSQDLNGRTVMRDRQDCTQAAHLLLERAPNIERVEVEAMNLKRGETSEKLVFTRDELGAVQCEFRTLKRVY